MFIDPLVTHLSTLSSPISEKLIMVVDQHGGPSAPRNGDCGREDHEKILKKQDNVRRQQQQGSQGHSCSQRRDQHYTSLPGPPLDDPLLRARYLNERHHFVTEMHEKYGDMFQWQLGGEDKEALVFVREPVAVKQILRETGVSFGKTWAAKAGRGGFPETGSTDLRDPAPGVTLQRQSLGSADADYVGNLVQPMLKGTIFSLAQDLGSSSDEGVVGESPSDTGASASPSSSPRDPWSPDEKRASVCPFFRRETTDTGASASPIPSSSVSSRPVVSRRKKAFGVSLLSSGNHRREGWSRC